MKKNILYTASLLLACLLVLAGCSEEDYELGALTTPSNLVVETELVGQSEETPYGDGSGEVRISVSADNAISYQIDFGTGENIEPVSFSGQTSHKFTTTGVNTYTLTILAFGRGGTATNITQDVTVETIFSPDPALVTAITGDASKTWVVDKANAGHFGVGPWSDASVTPEWYTAAPNEKEEAAGCFYTSSFTFTKSGEAQFSLDVNTPDGAFTKTGDLTTLPGIPDSGEEGCYTYAGASSPFSFVPSSSGIPATAPSTKTSIKLPGNETFIGYGAVQKEYEILEVTPDLLYLRVQGTETGNAWYIRLVPAE